MLEAGLDASCEVYSCSGCEVRMSERLQRPLCCPVSQRDRPVLAIPRVSKALSTSTVISSSEPDAMHLVCVQAVALCGRSRRGAASCRRGPGPDQPVPAPRQAAADAAG